PIITPFIADAWAAAISSLEPCDQQRFDDIPSSITHGFDMGVHSTLDQCFVPNNHASSLQHPDAVLKHINKELSLRRYSGPFSFSRLQHLIGNFRTSPLGV
ncbi:hypothetical protein FA15DRAFT_554840, partial [Coprinopsis marcescibilis]